MHNLATLSVELVLVVCVWGGYQLHGMATCYDSGAIAGTGRRGLSDRLTRWRNAIFRVARAPN